jgi:hypothetical protein
MDGWLFVLSELGCQSFLPFGIKFSLFQILWDISKRKHKFGVVN